MSKLMIQSGADKVKVPMKCDVEGFFVWYGDDVSMEDNEITALQYKDYVDTGKYFSEEYYKDKLNKE